jgi:Domain of unknown function (DUF4082)
MLRIACCTAALSLLVSSPLLAQTVCYAENDGNNYNDLVSMGGPNLILGVQFTVPSNLTVTRMEIFTGEGSGTNGLAIWSHNPATNTPLAQLSGTASWSMSNTDSWQGADLGTPYAITAGTTYWLGWACINGSQCSVDVPMATLGQFYSGSFDGGQSWSGPFQFNDRHWKFRLYGNCGGSGITSYCFGDGTAMACPCGSPNGAAGHGCSNSANPNGAVVTVLAGSNSIAAADLRFSSTGHRLSTLAVWFQGDVLASPVSYGDGLRCVGSPLVRLYNMSFSPGTMPDPLDSPASPSIVVRGGITVPGTVKGYFLAYRDPATYGCSATFNASNAMSVTWAP